MVPLDTAQEAMLVLRTLGSQHLASLAIRERRPHLMADSVSFELAEEEVWNKLSLSV